MYAEVDPEIDEIDKKEMCARTIAGLLGVIEELLNGQDPDPAETTAWIKAGFDCGVALAIDVREARGTEMTV